MVSRRFVFGDMQGERSDFEPILLYIDQLVPQLTDVFEGSLIRVFRRLQELIRQMTQAAKVIGNDELVQKFDKSLEMLARPNSVIFCSSLYL